MLSFVLQYGICRLKKGAMFTGIIQDIGTVLSLTQQGDLRIVVQCGLDLSTVVIGASIACGGACMTVVDKGGDWFAFDVSSESLSKTTLGQWQVGSRVNLEPSLKLGDELGGHIVSGHVDGLAELLELREEVFAGFVAQKGSVALDGVSLTVNEVSGNCFHVNIIPHTWEVTTLGDLKAGDCVNFEVDTLARYVARQLEVQVS